ncbi:MAG: hypothetical protein FJ122_00740 [Deltaproteobacteria bacterium]|nr:hypothetical protein [Deltaproteobacteria bacterium]
MTVFAAVAVWATPALASEDAETMVGSLLIALFLGFGALIIVLQLIPSLLLFVTMIIGLFDGAESRPLTKPGTKIL